MDNEKSVMNVFPVEETIFDPLYEPLKLHRYELCPYLQCLKDVSHLRYGFSPYLLFDMYGMREVIKEIGIELLFTLASTKNVKEQLTKESSKLEKVKKEFGGKHLTLVKPVKEKRDWGWVITDGNKKFYIIEENEDLNVYGEKVKAEEGENEEAKKVPDVFSKMLNEYLQELSSERENKNKQYGDLKKCRDIIKERIYDRIKGMHGEILNNFLYPIGQFEAKNFAKIAHFFRLESPHKVTCPICENEQHTCEEGKIYSMQEALLRTFELRRARWLYMSGSLHTVLRAATHTRLSHEIGSMIVAFNALRVIEVFPYRDMLMSLGEYLLMRSELHEFLMANLLHDIGHSPLSHVLEPNPFVELDHEEITRNLILGEKVEKKGMDWYVTERYLLKLKVIKDFEYRFFENRYDPIYDIGEKEGWNENERRTNFLDYLKKNDEILESEIITVSEVLDNFGIDKKRVIEILTGKIFCPKCRSLLKIKGNKVEKCETHGEAKIEIGKIYDTQFLNKLIHSEIDFDRIDHVKRDSVVCGLSLISFRLLELLGGMSIVLPGCKAYAEILDTKDKPYILISEDGMRYIMDLLTARRTVFKDILYSDENNWINGVVNQITALAVRYLPHLKNMLPYITDQILIHFYTNDLFLGTQIEKLNKLFHDKSDYSAYGNPMRYKLREGVIVKNADLQAMYNKIENINDGEKYKGMALPAVVFYTNVKETKCPVCRGNNLEERECNPNIKAVECKDCNKDEKGDENGGKMLYLVGIEEDIFKLSKCPICGEKIKERKDFQDVIECEKCGRMRKWSDENWDDILVYGKKFKIDGDEKYLQFEKLVGKYKDALRERFPERPSELDVKNLLYVWISDFVITENKGKEEWKDDIKVEIGGIWAGNEGKEESAEKSKEKIKEFENRFVDLDVVEEGI